jgi:RHS repeat-associated protein
VSVIELDPSGGETNRSSNESFQPRRFTTYERDAIMSDEAMHRRYNRWWSRFEQPDPYDGSYDLSNPQSFNRYAYVGNDPVNFVDPSGLDEEPPVLRPFDPNRPRDPNLEQPIRGGRFSPLIGNSVLGGDVLFDLVVSGEVHPSDGETGGAPGAQDPPSNPFDIRNLIRQAQQKKEARKRLQEEYEACVRTSPRLAEFNRELQKVPLDTPLPLIVTSGEGFLRKAVTGAKLGTKLNMVGLTLSVLWYGISLTLNTRQHTPAI